MNDTEIRIWNETVVACLKSVSRNFTVVTQHFRANCW